MPLWYVRQGDVIACWTYGVSQKVKNLERLPQATVQVEAGKKYAELRGVILVLATPARPTGQPQAVRTPIGRAGKGSLADVRPAACAISRPPCRARESEY